MSETFGTFGREMVGRVTISDGALAAKVITWGAVVQDLRLAGHAPPLVLGFESFDPYPAHSPYFGAVPGRVANRIRDARAPLDERTVELDANVRGVHHLHGGRAGIGRKNWRIEDLGAAHVTLAVDSPDGDMGYPGNYTARCTYRVADATLHVDLSATSDAPTFSNLVQHSYFNLADGGRTDILGHKLRIDADTFLEVDQDFIATGEPVSVGGTRFDFRELRTIHAGEGDPPIWDNNLCVSDEQVAMREVARLESPSGAVAMKVSTTEPGVQFYAGHKIDVPVPGLDGIRYVPRSGLCLETQAWPDGPNNPDYPSTVLRPGHTRSQKTAYAFHSASISP